MGEEPANNACSNATFVPSLPFLETGETSGAARDDNAADEESDACSAVERRSKIVWYEFEGDGSCFSVSLSGSGFDTALALYAGDCGSLECMKGNDDFGPEDLSSRLSWETDLGVRYKLAVGGADIFDAGFYQLNVTVSITECRCPFVRNWHVAH